MFEHWRPEQKQAIDCIACQKGVPARRVQYRSVMRVGYFSADHVVLATPAPRDRFNTRLLASKLAGALKGAHRGR